MQPVPGFGLFGRSTHSVKTVLDSGTHVLTRSARSALSLALHCAGVNPGDEVLVPNYYCPTMPAPVEWVGAVPVFYPILQSGFPDLHWLRKQAKRKYKAMVAAHFFGVPASSRLAACAWRRDSRRIRANVLRKSVSALDV